DAVRPVEPVGGERREGRGGATAVEHRDLVAGLAADGGEVADRGEPGAVGGHVEPLDVGLARVGRGGVVDPAPVEVQRGRVRRTHDGVEDGETVDVVDDAARLDGLERAADVDAAAAVDD